MSNHLHLLLQISDLPLGKVVQKIAQRYSRYRHKQLGTSGHLFECRYHARLVDVDAYLLVLLRYIHLNPVEARLTQDPAAYPWSSHRAFLGRESVPWLTTAFALSLFSDDVAEARRAYSRFMLECCGDQGLPDRVHTEDPRILGTNTFASSVPDAVMVPRDVVTLDQLAAEVCAKYSTSVLLLRSPTRGKNIAAARVELARRAAAEGAATLAQIARFLNRNASSVTRALERHDAIRRRGAA